MFDKNEVRQLCSSRWIEILSTFGGIPAEILDGGHHPCPKCGGHDRFRLVDVEAGALFCNHCFSSRNGDGFSALAWLTGKKFTDILDEVGQHVGAAEKKRGRKKGPPAFTPQGYSAGKALIWCVKQPGITPEGLKAAGAIFGQHFFEGRSVPCVALQHYNQNGSKGWSMMAMAGLMPAKHGAKKIKILFGSDPGMIGEVEKIANANLVIKLEGPKDVLALCSLPGRPEGVAIVTNSNGAKENPTKQPAFLKSIEGKNVIIIHDCDKPGQEGATSLPSKGPRPGRPGWLPACSRHAKSVKNVVLPYDIKESEGEDLRDWINEGGTWPKLLELFEKFDTVEEKEVAVIRKVTDADFLAEVNLHWYETSQEGKLMNWRNSWWKYKSGRWRQISDSELQKKVTQRVRIIFEEDYRQRILECSEDDSECRTTTSRLINDVIKSMASMVSPLSDHIDQPCLISNREHRHWLTVENGILDLGELTKENIDDINLENFLLEHTSDWFSQVKLDYQYDEAADCPIWKAYLNKVMEGDESMIRLLQQWCGYLLTTRNDLQKFMILEGPGGNGKSVFFAGITAMLGEENISNVTLESFSKKFDLGQTVGKIVNICGDISELDSVAEGHLKEFTGGGQMFFDRKNKEGITAVPTAKLIGSWNLRPHLRDRSEGIWRRIILVPFLYKIQDHERIYGMDTSKFWHEKNEVSGILNWAIEGLLDLQANEWNFEIPERADEARLDYAFETSATRQFIAEHISFGDEEIQLTDQQVIELQILYEAFVDFCKSTGIRNPLGRNKFKKEFEMAASVPFKKIRIGDRSTRGFLRIQFKTDSTFANKIF